MKTAKTAMPKRKRRSIESVRLERQEWLGDALLQFLSSRLLYARHPHLPEGGLTLAREAIVSGRALAAAARECGLAEQWGVVDMSDSVIAGKTEEYFAQCYLDGGLTAADDAMQKMLGGAIEQVEDKIAAGINLKNPKMMLQEMTQSGGEKIPTYTLIKKTGADHDAHFVVECRAQTADGKTMTTTGGGKTVRAAEQNAAEKCLQLLSDE